MPEVDLGYLLKLIEAMKIELREGLQTMRLRDEQREASYQTVIQVLTRQMVEATTSIDRIVNSFEQRLEERINTIDQRLSTIEQRLEELLTTGVRR
jgi:uncharacterized protein Yka (UPF0111/DUF47 family)